MGLATASLLPMWASAAADSNGNGNGNGNGTGTGSAREERGHRIVRRKEGLRGG
jgi:hypothetical protein